jgi:hypothetical protein
MILMLLGSRLFTVQKRLAPISGAANATRGNLSLTLVTLRSFLKRFSCLRSSGTQCAPAFSLLLIAHTADACVCESSSAICCLLCSHCFDKVRLTTHDCNLAKGVRACHYNLLATGNDADNALASPNRCVCWSPKISKACHHPVDKP